jgi:lipopolysaccharide biosynthesis glycosyltransferase
MNEKHENLTVVFFSDRWMLFGLHAALVSLLSHAKAKPVRVIVFSDKLTDREKKLLRRTVASFESHHTFEIRELSISWPKEIQSFHGNMTANARIFLTTLLPDCDYCLYLDCDVLVLRDVNELCGFYDYHSALMANVATLHEHATDYAPFCEAVAPNQYPLSYFNSGIFFASLTKWRAMQVESCCLSYFRKFKTTRLVCPDQTILNIVLKDCVQKLDDSWNLFLPPQCAPVDSSVFGKTILHFVGLPKPWYPLGCLAHKNFFVWFKWFRQTAIARDPLSLLIQFCTPRKHFICHFLGTIRLIFSRIRTLH